MIITFKNKLGDKLNEAITFNRIVGSTIDLTKEETVQKVISRIVNEKLSTNQ